MQLIQDLTLVQKVGAFIGIPLILLLVVVAARRRRTPAAAGQAAVVAQPKGRRARAKDEAPKPRRKRRKLADEGANSIAAVMPAAPAVPAEPATHAVEPVAATDVETSPVPEAPVAQSPPPVPVVPAPADDPYVRDTTFADDQVAAFVSDPQPVAAPGWPTPGELASSFDPDAFDPLPAAAEAEAVDDVFASLPAGPGMADEFDDAIAYDDPEQPTGIIEMPALQRSDPDEAEVARWDGEFDPATGWGDDEVPVAVAAGADEWYDAEGASHGGAPSPADEPNPVDLEQFWGEAETEDPWASSPEVEVVTDISAADVVDENVPAWAQDDESPAWDAAPPSDISVPFPAPGSLPAHDAPAAAWTMAAPAQGSPVVLDLAGLAASGHSLELVIESNGDGSGVRLRFGSPSGAAQPLESLEPATELAPAAVEEAEIDALVEAGDPLPEYDVAMVRDDGFEPQGEQSVAGDFDVPFLTGGRPEPEVAYVAVAESETVAHTPVLESPVEVTHLPVDEAEDAPAFEASHEEIEEFVAPEPTEVPPAATAEPEMDLSDDPVQILADIRARLAALDQRR